MALRAGSQCLKHTPSSMFYVWSADAKCWKKHKTHEVVCFVLDVRGSQMLRQEEGPCVSLSNPKHVEYEVVRTSLLPGALKTAQFNRAMTVGQVLSNVFL